VFVIVFHTLVGRVGLTEFRGEDNRVAAAALQPDPGAKGGLKEMNDMTVNAPASLSGTMDVDAFMAFLETRPKGEHWDLIEGVAVMMSPAGLVHQQVASNFRGLLNAAFAAKALDLYAFGDIGVRIPGVLDFQPEPDVTVVPGMHDAYYAEHFQLAAEALSPSDTRKLIDMKLRLYCGAPDNLYAVVIEPRKFWVEIHAKSGKWDPVVLKRPDDVIEMPEFGLRCPAADLYRRTPLDPRWPV
jgi:Uma2 family endonuclease